MLHAEHISPQSAQIKCSRSVDAQQGDEGFSAEERDAWNEELYKGAVAIGETVLYVKQHSVNCIPAALYMMTRIQSDLVTIGTCVKYIEDLFKEQDDIAESDKIAIQSHIQ